MKRLKYLTVTVLPCPFWQGPLWPWQVTRRSDAKLKPYTFKTCVVSGDKLGEMGDPFVYKYEDRELKFCCKSCVKDFNKEPAKYIKKIEEAEAKEKK